MSIEAVTEQGAGLEIVSPATPVTMDQIGEHEVFQVVIRACSVCGGKADLETLECPEHGPVTVIDNGLVSARYKSPVKQLLWRLYGRPAANRRIRQGNSKR